MGELNFALYLKFYESKINSIEEWRHLFENVKDKKNVKIYIWIESALFINELIEKYSVLYEYSKNYNFIIVTHANKWDFYDVPYVEDRIRHFVKDVGLTYQIGNLESRSGTGHVFAHLRSFLVPDEEYIFHIDADDLFVGDWLGYSQLIRAVNYMHNNGLQVMTKPFWVAINRGYSFSFLLQRKSFFNKLFIMDSENLPDDFKKNKFYEKNFDSYKGMNTDNYFGLILVSYYKYKFSEIFFSFIEDPFWLSSSILRHEFGSETNWIKFIEIFKIPILAEKDGKSYSFTLNEYKSDLNGYYYIKNYTGLYINPTCSNLLSKQPFKIKITTNNINHSHLCISETDKNIDGTIGCYLYTIPFDENVRVNGDDRFWSTFYFENISENKYHIRIYHYQPVLYEKIVKNKNNEPGSYLYMDNNVLKSNGSRSDATSTWILEKIIFVD